VRSMIVSPLRELERAARRLARGELLLVMEGRHDEVGSLGRTFNRMGQVIGEREERISAMNARLQGLLDNMRQAILVFDEKGCLGIERSRLARQIFGTADGSETSVVELLFPVGVASEVERDALRIWLSEAAKTSDRDFDEMSALAPKEAILLQDGEGERLLELEFRRAAADGAGKRFMLLATDVTSQRKLERSAESQARQHQKQLTAMRRLLAGGGQVFVRFLVSARERLSRAEESFRATGQLTPDVLEHAFRFVHTLRAEARSFDLERVETLLSELELGLGGARHAPLEAEVRAAAARQLQQGFASLALELQQAEQLFVQSSPIGRRVLDQVTVSRQDVTELFRRFGTRRDALGKLVARLAARPFGEVASNLPEALQRWSSKEGKKVELSLEGREALVPAGLSERLPGVLAHLLRNALAHGIETPFQRRALGKPDSGRIELSCQELPDGVSIEVRDDGAGFDLDLLRRRAAQHGHTGEAALELAFVAGVSTREGRDDLAGNGVGLGAVRDDLEQVGYKVSVSSQPGQGARVRIAPREALEPARYESVPVGQAQASNRAEVPHE
jgi:two-component system, chemotaxis family, sensor kinase CheA